MAITWNKQSFEKYGGNVYYGASYLGHSISRDGSTIIMTEGNYGALMSRDGGITWTFCALPLYGGATDYLEWSAAGDNGFVIVTTFYGKVLIYNWNTSYWDEVFPFDNFDGNIYERVACSEDGKYVALYFTGNYNVTPHYSDKCLCVSGDYGTTWNIYFQGTIINGIAMDRDGSNMLITTYEPTPVTGYKWKAYVSSDYGSNWTFISDLDNSDFGDDGYYYWVCSDDVGLNLAIFTYRSVYVWVSTNSGLNWIRKPIPSGGTGTSSGACDMSIDGSCLILAHDSAGCWFSSDLGNNWIEVFPESTTRDSGWIGAQFFGTSKLIITFCNNNSFIDPPYSEPLCISYDQGLTWDYILPYENLDVRDYWHVSSNATGTVFLAAGEGAAKYAYVSHNSGSTWEASPLSSGSLQDFTNYSIAMMSDDGMYMFLQDYNGKKTYRSIDSGSTWSESTPQTDMTVVDAAMSGNGKYVIIASRYSPVYLYISSDYGVSWSTDSINHGVSDIAINYMGSLMITTYSGTVQISRDYGISWTDITNTIRAQISYASLSSTLVTCDNSGQNIYLWSPYGYCVASHDSGYTWAVTPNLIVTPPLDYGKDIACSSTGGKIFWVSESNNTMGLSNSLGSTWSKDNYQAVQIWYTIGVNGAGTQILAGSQNGYVYLSSGEIFVGGGNIKSIGGVLFENIKKVSGIPIANLKKISGELN